MKKRGLAPVLIVVSSLATLALALILFLVVLPYAEKEVKEAGEEAIVCNPMELGFDVMHACSVANEVQLLLENSKEKNIEAFNIKVYGNKDVYESVTDSGITGFAIQKFYSNYDLGHTGKVDKITIYPVLKSGNRAAKCSNVVLEVKNLEDCTTGCMTCKTKKGICETATENYLCEGLDMLYGIGCRDACCTEYGLCCR